MKINKVSVTYGELRSAGYPSFSNKRYELTFEAELNDRIGTPELYRDWRSS